jgi:uncharacterized protein
LRRLFSSPHDPSQGPAPDEIKAFFKAIRVNNPGPFQNFLEKYRQEATKVREPETGSTPLMAAAKWGRLTMVEDLLYGAADVNAADAVGCSPLMLAAMNNKFDIVRLLLDKGANMEAKTVIGATALVFTTYDNATEAARELLKQGANTAALADHHWTAMMRALANERMSRPETDAASKLPRSEMEVRRRMALEFAKLRGNTGAATTVATVPVMGPANDASADKKTRIGDILAVASASSKTGST